MCCNQEPFEFNVLDFCNPTVHPEPMQRIEAALRATNERVRMDKEFNDQLCLAQAYQNALWSAKNRNQGVLPPLGIDKLDQFPLNPPEPSSVLLPQELFKKSTDQGCLDFCNGIRNQQEIGEPLPLLLTDSKHDLLSSLPHEQLTNSPCPPPPPLPPIQEGINDIIGDLFKSKEPIFQNSIDTVELPFMEKKQR